MRQTEPHISDDDLLKLMDGEIDGHRTKVMNAHLSDCWQCRTRRSGMESTIIEFMQVHQGNVELPPLDQATDAFKARLGEVAGSFHPSLWERSLQFVWLIRRHSYAGLIVLALLTGGAAIYFMMPEIGAAAIPNSRLTPGVVRAISTKELCSSPNSDEPHPIPDRLAFRVFDKYGIHDPQPRTYEVDYLIAPNLGGSDDVRNLWPQPYAAGVWNAHVKDALEDRLHELVCSGKVDLTTAQHDIASNWIAAYQKYFNTKLPLEFHASFSKDAPWQ